MRLTLFIVVVAGCLQVNASAYSQNITLALKDVPLGKVFQEIKKQSGYFFWYDNAVLERAGKVTVKLTESSIKEALDACFLNQPLSYTIVGKTVSVKLKLSQL